MKKADDIVIEKLLDLCKYIKWQNISEKEYQDIQKKIKNKKELNRK